MSKSTFYGSPANRGPRWTQVERLDLRCGPHGVTADRERFHRWFREVQGGLATGPHANAARLGGHAIRASSSDTYGEQLAALCLALEHKAISKQQFDQAVATLQLVAPPPSE